MKIDETRTGKPLLTGARPFDQLKMNFRVPSVIQHRISLLPLLH
jgi:hypothetical protein